MFKAAGDYPDEEQSGVSIAYGASAAILGLTLVFMYPGWPDHDPDTQVTTARFGVIRGVDCSSPVDAVNIVPIRQSGDVRAGLAETAIAEAEAIGAVVIAQQVCAASMMDNHIADGEMIDIYLRVRPAGENQPGSAGWELTATELHAYRKNSNGTALGGHDIFPEYPLGSY